MLHNGDTNIPGWTVVAPGAEILWGKNGNQWGPQTPYGNQFLDLTGCNQIPTGGVTQIINAINGSNYSVSFSLGTYGARSDTYGCPIRVKVTAGTAVQTFDYDPTGTGDHWKTFGFQFSGTGNDTPIIIQGLAGVGNGNYIGLNNVAVDSVPEPTTMLLLGLGLVGLAGVRRKFKE